MDAADHQSQLEYHQGWLDTGNALLAAANLIWPRVESGFDQFREYAAAIEAGSHVPKFPVDLLGTKFLGYCNTYLLNAGYAVENFLKAVRIKRLSLASAKIAFGGGDNRIPKRHTTYFEMGRVELGSLTDDEVALLRRLGLFVNWVGRYPMPIDPPPIGEVNGVVRSPQDKPEIDAFCHRLIEKYESLG